MQLGAQAVFVGSGIFGSDELVKMANAIVEAATHYQDPQILAKVSTGLGDAMKGLEMATLETNRRAGLVTGPVTVGVLALQGAFAAHLRSLGISVSKRARSRPTNSWFRSTRSSFRVASRPRCRCCS